MIKFLWINAINPLSEVESRYPNLSIGYLCAALKKSFGDDAFCFIIVSSNFSETLEFFYSNIIGISAVSLNYGIAVCCALGVKKKYQCFGGWCSYFIPSKLSFH